MSEEEDKYAKNIADEISIWDFLPQPKEICTESVLISSPSSPLAVQQSPGFGNYYVAARTIEPGELIFEEICLSASAYGLPDRSPYCLSCYKDLAYSQRCKICRWPVCDEICSAAPQHSKNECQILAKNKVRFKNGQIMFEYLGVETLRCLLFQNTNVQKWKQLLSLEGHTGPRSAGDNYLALKQNAHTKTFITKRCNLGDEFDEETINKILGIVCVNTFNGLPYVGRYVSIIFSEASLFNHNCQPNTVRRFVELTDGEGALKFIIQVMAVQHILPGETLSTSYGDITAGIIDRGEFLKEHFYFHCDCSRCRFELFNEVHHCQIQEIL